MKWLVTFFACLLPLAASAGVKLSNCDHNTYEIMVRNGGSTRTVTMTPTSGEIEEFGPVVSFQIQGSPPVVATTLSEEFCIWSGRIKLQRLNTSDSGNSGFSFR